MTRRAGQFFTDSAPPSSEVDAAVRESMRRSELLYPQLPTTYSGSLRIQYATRWLLLALEHRESFLMLVDANRRSSAYALMRSIYEAWSRGFWASSAASDAQIEAMSKGRYVPKMETIAKELSRQLDASISPAAAAANPELQRGAVARSKAMLWDSLSDFAHGGVQQLARWSEADGTIAPAHIDEEMVWMLRIVDVWGLITCAALFDAGGMGIPDVVQEILQELAAARPAELMPQRPRAG